MEGEEFKRGEKVKLDVGFANSSTVEVVRQSQPNKLFTRVRSEDGSEWDTMTSRLTKIKKDVK